jgi:LEA14-like dessication related protein
MTISRAQLIRCLFFTALLFVSGCAVMNPDYEEPIVELVSFKVLPATGFEQNFEIGLKLTNPNNFDLPFNGISYQLSVAGETLAQGVAANIPTARAYAESRFGVPVSTSLMGGIKVIRALMVSQGQNISYQLKAKLDIAIPFVPKLIVIQDGMIPLGLKRQ